MGKTILGVSTMTITRTVECWLLTSEFASTRAGSFRQERWCRYFLDAGVPVRVFNVTGTVAVTSAIFSTVDEMKATRTKWMREYRGPQTAIREGFSASLFRYIKHLLLLDLYLPNVIRLHKMLDDALRDRREPVLLMASSPPFSLALVGASIRSKHPECTVLSIDMRDAWALHNALGGIGPLKRVIERFVLRSADFVTTVSTGLAREFVDTYAADVKVMYNVATHYVGLPAPPRIDLAEIDSAIDSKRTTLIYTGSTPKDHYDLNGVIEALCIIRERRPELLARIQLVFVGACQEMRHVAESKGFGQPEIVFVPHLSHELIRSVQVSATALLFLGHHGPNNLGVVSTKIFEYLYLCVPIVPVDVCSGSDVDTVLKEYCGVSINTHGAAAIFRLFEQILDEGPGILPRTRNVNRLSELTDSYKDFVEILLKAGAATE